jgi:ATP-dependent DNA helicase RecG
MKPYSDGELLGMMRDVESDRVERKESMGGNAPKSVREAVCAFANDLAGHRAPGVVFVGLRDDGSPAGLAITDELLLQLANLKTDGNIVPPPSLLVEKRRLDGADVAVVTVWPCDTPPVRYQGRVHVRWGPRRGLASAQDERILNEKRRFADRPFDIQPVRGATLNELDELRFEREYLPALVAPDVLAANERTMAQRLAATKMVTNETEQTPTVLGLLVVGRRTPDDRIPGAYTQFLRLAGTDLTAPVVDEKAIHGTVGDQIRRLEEKLEAHNLRGVRFADVAREVRSEAYPMEALRQLVRNAHMHRSYEATNAPARVYWFDDRIEIHNPGGPFGSVTRENFGRAGVTDYRNPNLAEALRALGYVQRFGAGIAIARKALGERLRFEVEPGYVAAIVQGEPG